MGVEAEQETVVGDPASAGVLFLDAVAVVEHTDGPAEAAAPVLREHSGAVGLQPDDVRQFLALTADHRAAVEEAAAAERRVVVPDLVDDGGELHQRLVHRVPVDPAQLGVLAVGVVVALLGAAELVAVQEHRDALREQQGGDEVALLAGAKGQDVVVVRVPFLAAVPGAVVGFAVVVAFAVGVVVLLVVGHEVAHGKAVVRRDEVDRGHRAPGGAFVEVRGTGQAGGEFAQGRGLAAPEVADRVAVFAVPLGPLRREVAHLVAARADVPRLGDQLDLGDDRVLLDEFEEGGQLVHVVELAGQGGGEVEAEAVDVHFRHPVAQGVHQQLKGVRVPDVEGVAGAGVVHVVLQVVVHQPVVGLVVDALEGQRGAEVVAFGGVVVHHVQDHFDAGLVQLADHGLEFLHLVPDVAGGAVGVLRREEADRVVAPVVVEALLLERAVVDELVDGHELDRGDAELLQVLNHGRVRHAGVGAALLFGNFRVELGQALDVRLVDDRLVVGDPQLAVAVPLEERVDDDAVHGVRGRVAVIARVGVAEFVGEERRVPVDLALDGLGVGVHQQLVRVEAVAVFGFVRAVDPVAVLLSGLDLRQVAVPHVAVHFGQFDPGFGEVVSEEAQFHPLGALAEQGKIGASAVKSGSQRVSRSGPDFHVYSSCGTNIL